MAKEADRTAQDISMAYQADPMMSKLEEKKKLLEEIKKRVKTLKDPKNVLVIGELGVGKSSFINSAITSLTGKYDYYADIGKGTRHQTTTFRRITREEYWEPEDDTEKDLCLPSFIDIIGLDPSLSTPDEDEETVNSRMMTMAIHGQIRENADLLHVGKKLKGNLELKGKEEDKKLAVDMIIVVVSAKNFVIPMNLIDEIYTEATRKRKKIPVFGVMTKVDEAELDGEELEKRKAELCDAIGIVSTKFLACTNYMPGQAPNIDIDLNMLEFICTLCNPRFKAVELEKMEFEEPEPVVPEPVEPVIPNKKVNTESNFWKNAIFAAVFVAVLSFLIYLIVYNIGKMRT